MIRINTVAFPSPIHGALLNPIPSSPSISIHATGSDPGFAGRWAEYQCLHPLAYGVHHRRHLRGLNEVRTLGESPTPEQTGYRCQAQGQAQSLSWNLAQSQLVRMEGEGVETDDEEGVLVNVEAGDARIILKRMLPNLEVTFTGLKIARKKVEASVTFCFSVNSLQAQELVFWVRINKKNMFISTHFSIVCGCT